MKCPKCGAENKDGAGFCEACGYDLSADNIMKALDDGAEKKSTKLKKGKKVKKDKPEKAAEGGRKIKIKVILAAAAVIILAVAVWVLITMFSSTEGEKVMNNIPIGRDIAYAESKTGKSFALISKYDAMPKIGAFNNICESERGLKIEGLHLPEWAVAVTVGDDKTISRVIYYDFSQLQKSWKGCRRSAEIPETIIEYGMPEKTVERTMGFKPYTIIKEIDNTSTYVYRYYYPDESTGNDVVCNFYVVFSDLDGSVTDVYAKELDYGGFMLTVK